MKRNRFTCGLLVALFAAVLATLTIMPASAETSATALLRGYVSAKDTTGTNSVVIFPAASGRAIRLVSYQVVGDNADAVLVTYAGTANTALSAAATTTNLTVVSTNGFAADDMIVIQDPDDDSCSQYWVYGLAASTIQLTAAATEDSGARVYRMSHYAPVTIGSATVSADAEALWAAQVRMPMLLRLYTSGGTTEIIKRATVKYDVYPAD